MFINLPVMLQFECIYRFWYIVTWYGGIVAIVCRGGDGLWRVFGPGLKQLPEFGEHHSAKGAWRSCVRVMWGNRKWMVEQYFLN